jgi:hypothetical protein
LEKDTIKSEQELKTAIGQLDTGMAKNKEQTKRVKQLENQLREVENHYDSALLEKE